MRHLKRYLTPNLKKYLGSAGPILLTLVACQSSEPAFQTLTVTSLTDAQRDELYARFQPALLEAFPDHRIEVHPPIPVVPEGSTKTGKPGPVLWALQMPVIDLSTGQGYFARLGQDRQRFVLEPAETAAPLLDAEASSAFKIADADSVVAEAVAHARSEGYSVEGGAMVTAISAACSGRCVDVRYLGFQTGGDGHGHPSSVVYATVSLIDARVVSRTLFTLPTHEEGSQGE